ATRQPCAPRSVTSLAPVAGPRPAREPGLAGRFGLAGGFQLASVFVWAGEWGPVVTGAALPGSGAVLPGRPWAPGASHSSEVAARARQAPTAAGGRMARFTAGNSCLRPTRPRRAAPVEAQLVRILSKQTLSRAARAGASRRSRPEPVLALVSDRCDIHGHRW